MFERSNTAGSRDLTGGRPQAESWPTGRREELSTLQRWVGQDRATAAYVHGIAGVGKSVLARAFARTAEGMGHRVHCLDCRQIEPIRRAFQSALPVAIERTGTSTSELLILDGYEALRVLDPWLGQVFLPSLPPNVRVAVFSRQRPSTFWHQGAGTDGLQILSLGPLRRAHAVEVLQGHGVPASAAERMAAGTCGHPLALVLAGAAWRSRPHLELEEGSVQQALDALAEIYLSDVRSPSVRWALTAASAVRRVTESLLEAVGHEDPREAYEGLRSLSCVEVAPDGLRLHEAVQQALSRTLQARDPARFLEIRRAAWRHLAKEARTSGRAELWRYTADMLYLIRNPTLREAFFPSGSVGMAAESAVPSDGGRLREVARRHEPAEQVEQLMQWWRALPEAFTVVRDEAGAAIGLCCAFDPGTASDERLKQDPMTRTWMQHLQAHPIPAGQSVLFCRRWLSEADGERPSEVQAAFWLDIKRIYLQMRPHLRRVYLPLAELERYAGVASQLGFVPLPEAEVTSGSVRYQTAMLDFGPESVDGWLARLAAAELGITEEQSLLDEEARELVLDGRRVPLTRLEFDLFAYLERRPGAAVSRATLLDEVWQTCHGGGSNVVDVVVASLRKKLGAHARTIETVTGVGYRFRRP